MASDKILIRGAREHNLRSIDLEIPRDKLVVITGASESGKSSLVFDAISKNPRLAVHKVAKASSSALSP